MLNGGMAATFFGLQSCTSTIRSRLGLSGDSATELNIESEEADSGLLRIALSSAPGQLDPASAFTMESSQVLLAAYDSLVKVDRRLRPQPMLAEGWQVSEDLLTWTFFLRQQVVFHHNRLFTADDVVFTFNRLKDPVLRSPLFPALSIVDTVKEVDDFTVEFNLTAPYMDLPLLLGAAQARIVSRSYDESLLRSQPSGTGPFIVTQVNPGESIKFKRNPKYWLEERPDLMAGQPVYPIEEMHHIYMPAIEDQANALLKGQVDLIPNIGIQYIDEFKTSSEVEIVSIDSGAYQTVVMQAIRPPFSDVRVRQAIKHCLDRSAMQDTILRGHGELGNDHPIAPVFPFAANLPIREHNISLAKDLLTAAGYPDGIDLDLITSTTRPGMTELAESVAEMTRPANIRVRVIAVPADVYWSDYAGRVPFHIGNWNLRPTVDETLMLAYHSTSNGNEGYWADPKLDRWIEQARSEPDPEKRQALYSRAQELIKEEGAVAIPVFRPIMSAVSTRVKNFFPHPAGWLDLRGVQVTSLPA